MAMRFIRQTQQAGVNGEGLPRWAAGKTLGEVSQSSLRRGCRCQGGWRNVLGCQGPAADTSSSGGEWARGKIMREKMGQVLRLWSRLSIRQRALGSLGRRAIWPGSHWERITLHVQRKAELGEQEESRQETMVAQTRPGLAISAARVCVSEYL